MSRPAVRRMTTATRLALVLAGIAGVAAPAAASTPAASTPAAPATAAAPANQSEIDRRRYEESRPQKEVPFDPADFDKFVGYYRMGDSDNFAHVYRTGNHYFVQLTAQPPAEFFPENPTEFFMTTVAAQVSFAVGPDGRATGMVIHQNGMPHPLHRVSEAEFQAGSAALARQVKANTPSPGTRSMVIAYIRDLEHGSQDYDTMTPELAAVARPQLSKSVALMRKEGAFKSLAFVRVLPNGANAYIATFTGGKLLWVIMPLTKAGRVSGVFFRPYPL